MTANVEMLLGPHRFKMITTTLNDCGQDFSRRPD